MATGTPTGLYEAAGFYLLRAPVLPVGSYTALTPPPGGTAEAGREHTRARLRDLADDPRIAQAVHIASASLTAGLAHLPNSPAHDKKAARAYSTLLRYVIRMSTRPTPYGLFSGVAVGEFGGGATARLAADPVARTRTRADTAWLLAVVRELESGPLAGGLGTVVNPLLYRSGDRAVLPFADVYGQSDGRLVDFRVTAPVEIALRLAGQPGVCRDDIVNRIVADIAGATDEQARGLVDRLWDLHVLLSDLRPASTAALPDSDLLKRLDGVDAAEPIRAGLREVRRLADAVDDARGRAGVAGLTGLTEHQRRMTPDHKGETYQLDTALALADDGLPAQVGAAAADAAEILTRINAHRPRLPHIAEYHQAFLERYGVDAEIPLLEVLSPELGLDAPTSYTSPPRAFPLTPLHDTDDRQRDLAITAMLAETLHAGDDELELTDERLNRLAVWDPAVAAPRPSLDVYGQLVAASAEAVERGDWKLVIALGAMADGTRTLGRFYDLFDERSLERLRAFARAEEARSPDVTYAELSYLPSHGRAGNVTVHPLVRRHEICVNTSPSLPAEAQIRLDDILVGATGDRFYLRQRSTGRELRVTQGHMLSTLSAPNVCRLLLELSDDGIVPLAGWDWGPAAGSPYLPRVTRGRLVLSPAQWSLTGQRLGFPPATPLPEADEFYAAVQRWRERWRVPRHAYLTFMDNRLLIDFDNPLLVDELRDELRRARRDDRRGLLVLQEPLPGPADAWLADASGSAYLSEIVVPLLATAPVRRTPVSPAAPSPAVTRQALPRRRLVGEEWVYLKLYAARSQHNDLISGPLPQFVAGLRAAGLLDRWFYLRYCDPMPHLRVRLRAGGADEAAHLLLACSTWGRDLVRAGQAADLMFASYDREIERYGGPAAIDTLEQVFTANSDMTAALVGALRGRSIEMDPDVLGVATTHALYRQWGADPLTADNWAGPPANVSDALRRRYKKIQKRLCDLIAPWDDHPDPVARRHADALRDIVDRQAPAIAEAVPRLRALAADGQLTSSPERILASVSHMQFNRLVGVDQELERQTHHLLQLAVGAVRRRPVNGPKGA